MRRLLVLCALLVACLALPAMARADVFRPAYLEVIETKPGTYQVKLRVPAPSAEATSHLSVVLPPGAHRLGVERRTFEAGSASSRSVVVVDGGLEGKSLGIAGLESTPAVQDVLVRFVRRDGRVEVARLTPDDPSFAVARIPASGEVFGSYLRLGVEHILAGVDHLAFVVALVLVVRGGRRILGTITAFTLAHSLTLALATLGVVRVPPAPVEALIAFSIAFVALEVLHERAGRPGLTSRKPWLSAFAFGLLHGLGFAGALSEVGLPEHAIPLSLFAFNVGVELGQLAFVLTLLGLARATQAARSSLPPLVEKAPAYVIGGVAMFWAFERIAAFAA
jgi:hypothetical protein